LQNIVKTLIEGLRDSQIWRNNNNLTGELAKGAIRTQKTMNVAMPQFEESASCYEIFDGTASTVQTVIAMSADSLNILTGMFAYRLLKEKYAEAHVCFVLFESGSVFAGQGKNLKKTPIPVLEFLKKQGGGGRDNMGGFQYKTPTNADNYEERKDSLIRDFKNFLKMPYHKERSCSNE
jgi:nanoRNase/pAp phosphatase (c-di-AMP/oligoRNAs hydrolase)